MLDRLIETLEKHAQRSLDSSVQSQIAEKLGWILVTGTDAAKAILCGAHAVQSVSALLRGGPEHLRAMTTELAAWLDEHGYRNLEEARGATSVGNCANPHELERLNYAGLLHSWGAPDTTR